MQISLGWLKEDGYSENQVKTFNTEEQAFAFCVKHINKIARINGLRIHRDFEDTVETKVKEISADTILEAIREGL